MQLARQLPAFASVGGEPPAPPADSTIDLLGGLDEWDAKYGKRDHRQRLEERKGDGEGESDDEDDSIDCSDDGSHFYAYARAAPRGPLDLAADAELKSLRPFAVPVSRLGRNDGVFMFGQRRMSVKVASATGGGVHVVLNPQTKLSLRDFFHKFAATEEKRTAALRGAFGALTLLQAAGTNPAVLS